MGENDPRDDPPDRRDEDRLRKRRRRREDDDDDFERGEEAEVAETGAQRHRRRRRVEDDDDAGDEGLQYVIPINTSGLAIAAGYVGLISVLCFPAPFALILGILALRQLKRNPKLHGKGRAIFAIVMGILFTIPLPIILIAAALGK
ncbi:MAG TPA: DUF4190 domain-containing protein [Urbifossiella sp.]|jgi:hypothetical protein|nr:DUF4190 domain-containing protein [Urbifossiella sp.]